jgi:uncharacterized protein YfaS (alpha-2-macroglobulin family)
VTYPNVLVLNYLKTTGQTSPEVQMQAEQYINLGYQRLLTFEVDGGGFSLFGTPPAQAFLTAYGLMEFNDMAKVHPVDPALIERTAQWLLRQQNSDGTWAEKVYSEHWRIDDQAPTTAYIAWALIEAGYGDTAEIERALEYIREQALGQEDAYSLALVANALAAAAPDDAFTQKVLDKLVGMAQDNNGAAYWEMSGKSFMGGGGKSGSVETTALAAYALLTADAHPDVANRALTYLVRVKDSFGTWQTTQATILSLKALLRSVEKAGEAAEATVTVSLNGEGTDPIHITPETFDVVQLVTFSDRPFEGENRVEIAVEGEGDLMYQVTAEYYLPWEFVAEEPGEAVTIDVAYDRTELAMNDEANVSVKVALNGPGLIANMMLVDLGIPPGFEVLAEDLNRLVEGGLGREEGVRLSRFDLTGRQIILYLEDLAYGEPFAFNFRLRAKYPVKAQIPASVAYDYYDPDLHAVARPQAMTVSE